MGNPPDEWSVERAGGNLKIEINASISMRCLAAVLNQGLAHAPDVCLLLNVVEDMVSLGLGHAIATY